MAYHEYHTTATYARLKDKTVQWAYLQMKSGKVKTEIIAGKKFIKLKLEKQCATSQNPQSNNGITT